MNGLFTFPLLMEFKPCQGWVVETATKYTFKPEVIRQLSLMEITVSNTLTG